MKAPWTYKGDKEFFLGEEPKEKEMTTMAKSIKDLVARIGAAEIYGSPEVTWDDEHWTHPDESAHSRIETTISALFVAELQGLKVKIDWDKFSSEYGDIVYEVNSKIDGRIKELQADR